MKTFITLALLCIVALSGVRVEAMESPSYSIQQIPVEFDLPPSGGDSSMVISDEARESSVVASDYMLSPQLMDFNANGVVASAIYPGSADEKAALDYGLTTGDKTSLLLTDANGFKDTIAVRVPNGARYPHTLSMRVIDVPKTLGGDLIGATICSSLSPCTLQQASEWDGELGLGYRVDGKAANADFASPDAYRSFQATTEPVQLGSWTKNDTSDPDLKYDFAMRAELLSSQKTATYWGRLQYILWPEF